MASCSKSPLAASASTTLLAAPAWRYTASAVSQSFTPLNRSPRPSLAVSLPSCGGERGGAAHASSAAQHHLLHTTRRGVCHGEQGEKMGAAGEMRC